MELDLGKLTKENILRRVKKDIKETCGNRYGKISIKNIDIDPSKTVSFAVAHVELECSKNSHKYFLYSFFDCGINIIFKDSNIIDSDKFYTIEYCKDRTKKAFNYYLKNI